MHSAFGTDKSVPYTYEDFVCSFWPGISTRVYTDEQLAELSAKNIEYNGRMYSRYEINQMQRERERNVRKWKKTWMIEKEAGLDTTSAAIRLRNARKSLKTLQRLPAAV